MHCHEPPYAIAELIETSCLMPGHYALHATMRGAQGEVDTAVLPVTVLPMQHLGRTPYRVLSADTDRSPPPFPATLHL